jgi:hypothetical protein
MTGWFVPPVVILVALGIGLVILALVRALG